MAERTQTHVLPAPPRVAGGLPASDAAQLNRWLEGLLRYVNGVNPGRFNGLYLPGLPTTGYGLIEGEVFSNGGILTIVQADDIWVGSLSATGEVGTVTVTV